MCMRPSSSVPIADYPVLFVEFKLPEHRFSVCQLIYGQLIKQNTI